MYGYVCVCFNFVVEATIAARRALTLFQIQFYSLDNNHMFPCHTKDVPGSSRKNIYYLSRVCRSSALILLQLAFWLRSLGGCLESRFYFLPNSDGLCVWHRQQKTSCLVLNDCIDCNFLPNIEKKKHSEHFASQIVFLPEVSGNSGWSSWQLNLLSVSLRSPNSKLTRTDLAASASSCQCANLQTGLLQD